MDEEHDLHRDASADPIEPADALLHRHRVPGQIEEHQAGAELEVAAFTSTLGRNQQARAVGATEACDLEVAPRRGEVFVEDAGRELGTVAERLAKPQGGLAMRDEHEGLVARLLPLPTSGREPGEPGVVSVGLRGLQAQVLFVG